MRQRAKPPHPLEKRAHELTEVLARNGKDAPAELLELSPMARIAYASEILALDLYDAVDYDSDVKKLLGASGIDS